MNKEILDNIYWNNTVREYLVALAILLGAMIAFAILQKVILSRFKKFAQKTKTDIDDTIIEIIESIRPRFYSFVAFYIALRALTLPDLLMKVIEIILIMWAVYMIVNAVQILINYIVNRKLNDGDASNDRGAQSAAQAIGLISKIVLWSFALLFVLSNLGVNITSLVAGLGIGGIALAFALQNILEDLFSSFAIYFDKPFVPGDFIVIGESVGTVEHIGIKTTRITALGGEELVISNRELTSARIQNYKKMNKRRIVFGFGVLYETPQNKLEAIPDTVKEVIDGVENVRFDRAHFKSFGDSSLDFEVVYYMLNNDYAQYMDAQQRINFALNKKFGEQGIDFAYPTRTVYMSKSE